MGLTKRLIQLGCFAATNVLASGALSVVLAQGALSIQADEDRTVQLPKEELETELKIFLDAVRNSEVEKLALNWIEKREPKG